MMNSARGEFEFSLGEKKFVIEVVYKRVKALEDALHKTLIQLSFELVKEEKNEKGDSRITAMRMVSLEEAVKMIQIMAKEPVLTEDEIGDLVLQVGLSAVSPLIAGLINRVIRGVANTDSLGNVPAETKGA